MPRYDCKCRKCGEMSEVVMLMSEFKEFVKCPECGDKADICISVPQISVDNPRISTSMAVHPKMLEDGTAYSIHPGAEFITSGPWKGAMKIKNRQEKLQRLKEHNKAYGTNLVELD